MTKDEVRKILEKQYKEVYCQFKELEKIKYPVLSEFEYKEALKKEQDDIRKKKKEPLKTMSFVWRFATSDEEDEKRMGEEPFCFVVELATENIPEAYMDASRHDAFRKKYPKICPDFGIYDLLYGPLSILRYEKTIRDYILDFSAEKLTNASRKDPEYRKQLETQANSEARKIWRRAREKVLCGPTGEYEEKTTWEWLEKYVFPFATRDIWESLREFYSPDAFVPPEDMDKFNSLFEKYISTIPGGEDRNISEKIDGKSKPKASPNKKLENAKDIQKIDDPAVYEKKLNKEIKKVSKNDLVYAFFAEQKGPGFGDQYDIGAMSMKITEVFCKAEEAKVLDFIKDLGLTYTDITDRWQVIKRIFVRSTFVPEVWQQVFERMLDMSLRGNEDFLRLWLAFIIDCGLYRKLIGSNLKFWINFPEDNVIRLINVIRDIGSYDEEPVDCIYQLIYEHKDENDVFKNMWIRMRKEWIMKALQNDNKAMGANQIRKFRQNYCCDSEEMGDLMDFIFLYMYEAQHESVRISSSDSSSENFIRSSNTVMRPIDALIDNIDNMTNDAPEEQRSALTSIKKSVQDIKDKFSYFVETWNE